uniref:Putative RNA-directed DNA polymerase from transposon BS n=1 Tax=Lygus hesperus TaxID=30085 RepID=A0A146LXR6_LYGHE
MRVAHSKPAAGRVIFWNCRGFSNMSFCFQKFSDKDIICLSETHLLCPPISRPSCLEGFEIIHSFACRKSLRGRGSGGLAVCFKGSSFSSEVIHVNDKWIFLKLSSGAGDMIIGNIYLKSGISPLILEELGNILEVVASVECYPSLILGGDWNVRVGNLNSVSGEELPSHLEPGRLSLDPVVSSGARDMVDLLESYGLMLLNGRTRSDSPGGFTFCSSNGRSTIDLVWGGLPDCVQDLEVATDWVSGSDHFPIIVKLWGHAPGPPRVKTVLRWKPELAQAYFDRLKYSDRVALVGSCLDIEVLSENMFQAIKETSEALGMRIDIIENSNLKFPKWHDKECVSARKDLVNFQKFCKSVNYVEPFATELVRMKKALSNFLNWKREGFNRCMWGKLAMVRCSRQFWEAVNFFRSGSHVAIPIPLDDWVTFYSGLYPPRVSDDGDFYDVRHPWLDREFTTEEVAASIGRCRAGKAPGSDELSAEFYQHLPSNWICYLTCLFNRIFDQEELPNRWSELLLVVLHKKGDMGDPNHYRGIALVNLIVKIFTQVLKDRLEAWVEECNLLPEIQAGFRRGRSCMDNVFVLSAVIGLQLRLRQRCAFCVFVDFKRAFDSINHSKLWYKLHTLGVSSKFIRILRYLYSNACFRVRVNGQLSEAVDLTEGVLQGEILSPLLFALYLADIESFFRARNVRGLNINGSSDLILLLYADDMTLLGDSLVDINHKLRILQEYCELSQLTVNTGKTKLVCFRRCGGIKPLTSPVMFGDTQLEQVRSYTYLGVPFPSSGVFSETSGYFCSKANTAVGAACQIMIKTKLKSWEARNTLFNALVKSVLLYSAAVWSLRYLDVIERVQIGYLKRLFLVSRSTPDAIVRSEAGMLPLAALVIQDALRWLGKVACMPVERLPRQCLERMIHLAQRDCDLRYNWYAQLRLVLRNYECVALEIAQNQAFSAEQFRGVSNRVMPGLIDKLFMKDRDSIINSRYSLVYKSISSFTPGIPANYLVADWPVSALRTFAQLRAIGKHSARILVDMQVLKLDPSSLCPLCNWSACDDLTHLFFGCPMLRCARVKFITPVTLTPLLPAEQFKRWLNSSDRTLGVRFAAFIKEAIGIRDLILSV